MAVKIIKLTPSKNVKDRYYIDLDDGRNIKITLNQIADYSLFTGRVLEDEELAGILRDAGRETIRSTALRILGSRNLSVGEMKAKLLEKGFEECDIDDTTEWMCSAKLLNDTEYAASIVRHYSAKGCGINKIKDELYRRKIPRAMWEEALGLLPKEEDTLETVLDLARKRCRDVHDEKEVRRVIAFLQRRGFNYSEISRAVGIMKAEDSEW